MGMTIEGAIKHAEEVAEVQEEAAKEWHENQVRKCKLFSFAEMDYTHENECKKCAEEHRQLAEWLEDYRRLLGAIKEIKAEITEPNEMDSLENSNVWQGWFLKLIDKYTSGKEEE